MTSHSVKIRLLVAPEPPLTAFDPGEYLSSLEFYETTDTITEMDRDGLAQLVHYLAFLALSSKSDKWEASLVRHGTLAYKALSSHFGHLDAWHAVANNPEGVHYRALASFLLPCYPPRRPNQ